MISFRYAHSEGHTDLCYSDDSKFIITCGTEGDVRIWEGANDSDQRDICVGESAWAVAQKGSNFYVGTDANVIQAYTFPELETDGIITRFTAPVTQIDLSTDGKKLVAGSCDMEIHVVDICSMDCRKLIGHKAPVLSVSIDPKSEFVASSSCDGTVRIWSLSNGDIIKQWDLLEKSNSFELAPSLCRLHFSCDGLKLAIPLKSDIIIHERISWKKIQSFSIGSNHVFNIAKFSPDGKFIAGGSGQGGIFVWDIATENIIYEAVDKNERAITAIGWRNNSEGLAYCNLAGQLADVDINIQPEEQVDEEDTSKTPLGEPMFVDDDDDNENAISLEKIKAQSGFGINIDESSVKGGSDHGDNDKESVADSYVKDSAHFNTSELQSVFQPSSTPLHLLQRFMVWNSVGIVRQFNNDDTNEIDVEFHDVSVHHPFRINNLLGHTMAALSSQALILACPKSMTSPSKLVCILLKAWDGQKEWDYSLGHDEALAVAAGDNWVAVATDTNMLRLFTVDGSQTDVFAVPGPIVCMSGFKNELFIVYHTGVGLDGEQFLSFSSLEIGRQKLFSCLHLQPLPLSPKSNLKWIGFTDEGSLASADSTGMLRIKYNKLWRPLCDLDDHCKSQFDHYFVVGISEVNQSTRCILCKGAYYPPVLPKPLITEVKWQIPLCEIDSEKGLLEEEMLRNLITMPNLLYLDNAEYDQSKKNIEKTISVTVMKLFALACRSGLEGRAITLCESMPSIEVVKLASKYAGKLGRHQLANRISAIASKLNHTSETVPEEKNERRVEPNTESSKESYSQDLFEDNETVKENFIIKMQMKAQTLSPRPLRIPKRHDNPFRKTKVDVSSLHNSDQSEPNLEIKLTFMQWYAKNQAKLRTEFPLLKEGELAIAGMKRYKQETLKQPILEPQDEVRENSNSQKDDSNDSKKRKNSPDSEDPLKPLSKKPAASISKLKSFSFSKK